MDKYNMFRSAESEWTTKDNVVDVTLDFYRLYWYEMDLYAIFLGTVSKMLYSFSLKRNVRQLFSVNESPEDIRSVHGIRALNALMLLASHKSMAMFFNPYSNRTAMTEVTTLILYYMKNDCINWCVHGDYYYYWYEIFRDLLTTIFSIFFGGYCIICLSESL